MTENKSKKRVGILRGGAGDYHTSSIKKGGEILLHIHENLSEKYKPVDVLVDRDHVWHLGGLPISPSELMNKVDVVWNTAHQSFSNILESLSIPSVGPGHFVGTLETSKEMLRSHIAQVGISMPRAILFPVYQKDFDGPRERYLIKKAKEVFEKFGSPWIVKSFTPDTNMGIHLAKTFDELVGGIEDGVNHGQSILVEEFIAGKVASTHSVAKFRGDEVYVFPIGNYFTNLTVEDKQKITASSKDLHKHIGAKHYLRADFVLTPKGKLYLLNIDSMPNLKPGSHFSQVCESVGAKMHEVVEHILEKSSV